MVTARVLAKEPVIGNESFTISAGRTGREAGWLCDRRRAGGVVTEGAARGQGDGYYVARCSSARLWRAAPKRRCAGALQTADSPVCDLSYLPYNTELVAGDKVITSGFGGVFPREL